MTTKIKFQTSEADDNSVAFIKNYQKLVEAIRCFRLVISGLVVDAAVTLDRSHL